MLSAWAKNWGDHWAAAAAYAGRVAQSLSGNPQCIRKRTFGIVSFVPSNSPGTDLHPSPARQRQYGSREFPDGH